MGSSTGSDRVNGTARKAKDAPSSDGGNGKGRQGGRTPSRDGANGGKGRSNNGRNGERQRVHAPSSDGANGPDAHALPSSGDAALDLLVAAANRAALTAPPLTDGPNGVAPPSSDGDNGAAAPSPDGANGHDERGRFTRGNQGGHGNPFGRRAAALRRAARDAASEQDLQALMQRLLYESLQGDVAAAKLLLEYVIGRPAEAVNPDTLHLQEWQLYQQLPIKPEELSGILLGVPADVACDFVRVTLPILAQVVIRKFQDGLRPGAAQEVPAPSAAEVSVT